MLRLTISEAVPSQGIGGPTTRRTIMLLMGDCLLSVEACPYGLEQGGLMLEESGGRGGKRRHYFDAGANVRVERI